MAALGLALAAAAVVSWIALSPPAKGVSRATLEPVVERDSIGFSGSAIPDPVLDRLAANQVVVLGETHHLREHWALVATLLRELHPRGFRQLLFEAPQMADWIFDDYVTGGTLEPGFEPPAFWYQRLAAIRAYNETLPKGERVHVRGIDVNEEHYGGAAAFRDTLAALARHLPTAGPVEAFLKAPYGTREAQTEAAEALRATLESRRPTLVASWGRDRYDQIREMADVERASIDIRAERRQDDNRAARMREDVIKRLADARVGDYPHRTVINIGGHHAQKAHLMGTKQEWLGDYLVHRSPAITGTVIVVAVTSARTELEPGASGTPFDVRDSSPENELFRVIAETRPGEDVFLPLDDPLFSEHRVAVDSEEVLYVSPFKNQYDAVLQYGLAHRMPD